MIGYAFQNLVALIKYGNKCIYICFKGNKTDNQFLNDSGKHL